MRRLWSIVVLVGLLFTLVGPVTVMAQDPVSSSNEPPLVMFTAYPKQIIGIKETVNIDLKLRANGAPQVVDLDLEKVPEGWSASFKGGGRAIQAAYVQPKTDENTNDTTVTLKLEPPENVKSGKYEFVVVGRSGQNTVRLPLELTVEEKAPARLKLSTDLPTVTGGPTTTFRYTVKLQNEGDEDLTVTLSADAPDGFRTTFKLTGSEVTSLPLEANQSKSLSVEVKAFKDITAGPYAITVRAQGSDTEATLPLTAQVTGEATLNVTTLDGRLSGEAQAGRETQLKLIVSNTGSAAAQGVEMSSTEPTGWKVEFEPKKIDQIPAGQQAEVTMKFTPAEKALAGDYMLTVRARPTDSSTKSVDFRITVTTSTVWGVVGIALIAVAVVVVSLAVLQFGRR